MPDDDQPAIAAAQEAADDQAVGHAVRAGARTVFSTVFVGRQGVIIGALGLLLAGREGWHAFQATEVAPPTVAAKEMKRMESTLNELNNNVLDIKVKVGAMLDVMPRSQKDQANALIRDRMEVLAEARRLAARSEQ